MTKRSLVAVVVLAVFILVPVAASAATSLFEDVPDDSIFVNDINWMAEAGVTKGCNPPLNTKYCPENNVSREQMAAFMHRLAVNQVVDAATVQGMTAADLKGQTGDTGPEGPAGVDGVDGVDGAVGPQGIPGPSPIAEYRSGVVTGVNNTSGSPITETFLLPAGVVVTDFSVNTRSGSCRFEVFYNGIEVFWQGETVVNTIVKFWSMQTGIMADGANLTIEGYSHTSNDCSDQGITWAGYVPSS